MIKKKWQSAINDDVHSEKNRIVVKENLTLKPYSTVLRVSYVLLNIGLKTSSRVLSLILVEHSNMKA